MIDAPPPLEVSNVHFHGPEDLADPRAHGAPAENGGGIAGEAPAPRQPGLRVPLVRRCAHFPEQRYRASQDPLSHGVAVAPRGVQQRDPAVGQPPPVDPRDVHEGVGYHDAGGGGIHPLGAGAPGGVLGGQALLPGDDIVAPRYEFNPGVARYRAAARRRPPEDESEFQRDRFQLPRLLRAEIQRLGDPQYPLHGNFNPFLHPEKKKIGEKIKKMALARPPSDTADRNFQGNHTSLRHTNCDALPREQRGGCGGGGSATARRRRQLGGGAATVAASAAVAAARQRDVSVGGSAPARCRR